MSHKQLFRHAVYALPFAVKVYHHKRAGISSPLFFQCLIALHLHTVYPGCMQISVVAYYPLLGHPRSRLKCGICGLLILRPSVICSRRYPINERTRRALGCHASGWQAPSWNHVTVSPDKRSNDYFTWVSCRTRRIRQSYRKSRVWRQGWPEIANHEPGGWKYKVKSQRQPKMGIWPERGTSPRPNVQTFKSSSIIHW